MSPQAKVSVIKCPDYQEERVEEALRQSVELIGGLKSVIKPGDKVLLKVNLLAPVEAHAAVTTHPSVVKATIKMVKEAGGIPLIADSPGFLYTAQNNRALRKSGIMEIAEAMEAEARQFESVENPFVKIDFPEGLWLKSLFYARLALEADCIISIPKLKTHGLTLFTGAVKNMFGAVAPKTRRAAHLLAKYEKFSGSVVDIYAFKKPDLAIMDAVVGMEGGGPRHGKPRNVGIILASYDCVSLDAVASKIIGFDPFDIYTTRLAHERGFGVGDIESIETVGENVEDVYIDFEKPPVRKTNIPTFAMKLFDRYLKIEPRLVEDKCSRCKICEESCPVESIKMSPYPVIDRDKCIQCFCCNEMCTEGAMEIKRNWLAKRVMG